MIMMMMKFLEGMDLAQGTVDLEPGILFRIHPFAICIK